MRKEPFFEGDIVHVFNRGNRKQEIVRDEKDRIRFVQMLHYFNDEHSPPNLFRQLNRWKSDFYQGFERMPDWPEKEPLVYILAFVMVENHFHLLLQEIKEGGITKFMQKLGTGMTNRFNTKYGEVGSLFQGAYKARRVDKDTYLQYLAVYLHIKNVFELFPGGIEAAVGQFDQAFEFAVAHPYSSLGGYLSEEHPSTSIIQKDMLKDIISNKEEFKEFARACVPFMEFDDKHVTLSVEV